MPKLLEIEDLAVAFPTGRGGWKRVVDGVSVEIEEGASLALVGASGSGKSLTCLAALGLVPEGGRIAGGRVRLAGVEVRTAGEEQLRALRGRVASLVQQEPAANFNPVQRLWRAVSEAAARHHLAAGARQRKGLAIRLLAEVGLEDAEAMAEAFPHQLSGGQRQRAAVAAALAAEPRLLVADEPTSALDAVSQVELLQLLARLRRDRGLGVLLVTHDLELAAAAAERMAVLHAGETVEIGASARLMQGPAHPCTQALVAGNGSASAPREPERSRCRFLAACPRAMPRCRQARPALAAGPEGGSVRCFLWHDEAEPPYG
ncbi:MAG TPA: ABC transporter ATP-binding protein [Thermoanaerobaculaceae bacterium]|nr:ABC transporter ATP-binding protein [Thermoanaerobaculaceae bacterium]HRS16768.1 ABC transporter ATP-binding protein [Thermoanaerobaculaceae bacterium]